MNSFDCFPLNKSILLAKHEDGEAYWFGYIRALKTFRVQKKC